MLPAESHPLLGRRHGSTRQAPGPLAFVLDLLYDQGVADYKSAYALHDDSPRCADGERVVYRGHWRLTVVCVVSPERYVEVAADMRPMVRFFPGGRIWRQPAST